jgi:flagellar hook-length control protein FliK
MTATHVGSLSASTVAAKTAASTSAPESPGTAPFHQRLQDARGQGGSSAHAPAPHDGHPQRGPDPGRDRRDDPSPRGPASRPSSPAAARMEKSGDAAATPPNSSVGAAAPTAPAGVPPQTAVPEAVADIAGVEPATGKDGEHEEAATALVEAMLALLGPAPVRPAAAGAVAPGVAAAAAAQLAAAQAGLAALGQAGGATPAVDPAVLAATVTAPAAELLKPDPGATREAARLDATPGVAPAITHLAATPAPTTAPVPVAPAHAFAQELGQQLAWFVGHDVKQARIRLHPEELGSLDLKISVQHNRVDVVLQAQHPGAVTAVQQALPQLDQMLAQHGLSLGHADVGQHDRGDQTGQRGHGDEAAAIDEVAGPSQVTPLTQLGLVDAFA